MYLKFIGQNNSMGLKRGRIYRVKIFTSHDHICVCWGFGKCCPYSSPKTLAKNWSKP